MTPLPIEPYRPRRIQPLGVVERDGWTIKLIGITAGADLPGDERLWPADPDFAGYLATTFTHDGPTS